MRRRYQDQTYSNSYLGIGRASDYTRSAGTSVEDPAIYRSLYDCTPFAASVPVHEFYRQNFDHAGFEPLCAATYGVLQGLDSRLSRDLPYVAFLHTMGTILLTAQLDSLFDEGVRPVAGHGGKAQDILPHNYVVPGPINHYISYLSPVIAPGGHEIRPNVPPIAVPRGRYTDREGNEIPSGMFGPVDEITHNVYECYLCPYTTSRAVIESQKQQPDHNWRPLPKELEPAGGKPTRDFVGYVPLQQLHIKGREQLSNCKFEDGNDLAGRLRYNPILFSRVMNKLNTLTDKFKMIHYGVETGSRNYVKYKPQPGNLIFCRANDNRCPLSSSLVDLYSDYAFGRDAAGASGIFTLHRERSADVPGCCYQFDDSNSKPAWVNSRNANFMMDFPFLPTRGPDLVHLRDILHHSLSPRGPQTATLTAFINRNYLI